MGQYLAMVVDWLRPRAEIGAIGELSWPHVIAGALSLPTIAWLFYRTWRRGDAWVRASLVTAMAALSLVLHIVPIAIRTTAADRFLYVPLAFLLVAIAVIAKPQGSRSLKWIAGLVALTSIPATIIRAQDWADPLRLWSKEWRINGGKGSIVALQIGNLQAQAGDFQEAQLTFRQLLDSAPPDAAVPAVVSMNLAMMSVKLGNYTEAVSILEDLVERQPSVPRFWRELAAAQTAAFAFDDALTSARRAIQLMPSYEGVRRVITLVEETKRERPLLDIPSTPATKRAKIFSACGRAPDTERAWLEVLRNHPSDADASEAIYYIATYGSAEAVSRALALDRETFARHPELLPLLRDKHTMHERLANLRLSEAKP